MLATLLVAVLSAGPGQDGRPNGPRPDGEPRVGQAETCSEIHGGCDDRGPGVCTDCGKAETRCGHEKLCKACAQKKGICSYCLKPLKSVPVDGKIQEAIDKALPGHKAGREYSTDRTRKVFKGLEIHRVVHGSCKTCQENSEPLAILVENAVKIVRTEKELEAVLKALKIEAKPAETALAAAQLVQALWHPEHGGLKPDELEKVALQDTEMKDTDHIASFEYKKGHAYWSLSVGLRANGAVSWLHVKDTGRMCK